MTCNSYYITASFIPCNTDSYYNVITITVYQTCPRKFRQWTNVITNILDNKIFKSLGNLTYNDSSVTQITFNSKRQIKDNFLLLFN